MQALRFAAPAAAYVRSGSLYRAQRVVVVRAAATDDAKPKPDNKITKGDLKEIVRESTGMTMADTTRAMDAILDAIVASVASGKEVVIPGFGSFKPRARAARTGRNPKTGEALQIAARTSVAFTAGKGFKDIVAGSTPAPK